jgi:branched-chain amino acid transport system ATP-binding protein
MLLELEDLRVHYGRAEALRGISLGVNEGSIATLIGANGAGKTTTLRTISGLVRPTSGRIRFRGKRIDGMATHDIVKLGIAHLPEGRIVFSPMTVLDNLKMGAYLNKNGRQVAADIGRMYEHFPVLKERQKQLAGSLSGGEQQMLAVARALMASPRLLLMDEPSLGLAPLMVAEVARIIREINESGISIILVEQNARMALNLASRAYILEVGRITLEGDAKELVHDDRVKQAYLGG